MMRKVVIVAAREYLAAVRTKSFVVSLLVLPLMMGGSMLVRLLLEDQVDIQEKRFAIVDRTAEPYLYQAIQDAAKKRNAEGIFDQQREKQILPVFTVERVAATAATPEAIDHQRYELSERVRAKDLFGFLEIDPKSTKNGPEQSSLDPMVAEAARPIVLRYYSDSPTYQDFQRWVEGVVNQAAQERRFAAIDSKLKGPNLRALLRRAEMEVKGLVKRDAATGHIENAKDEDPLASMLLPGGLMFVMFMMIVVGATPLMHGIVEEKMQRIAEVLLGSVRPFELMMGKLLGMAAVSLTLTAVYLSAGYLAAYYHNCTQYLSSEVLAWFIVYQMLAVLMYGSLFIAIGAACTDLRETQTMMWPVMLLVTAPMFLLSNVIREPNSAIVQGISFFPFATPIIMLGRLAVPPGLPWWQPALGVLGVLAAVTLCVYAAGRIFRVGILIQGKGARMGDVLQWVFRG
jgi:ABC-2 type transport system permease protein